MLVHEYYVILAFVDGRDCPSFVTITKDGYMIQGNIYDSSKFIVYDNILPSLEIVKNTFKDYTFEIANVSSRIFGTKPRFVYDKNRESGD